MAAREAAVFKAQLAGIAHRYEDMAEAMKSVALMDEELTLEEGNLLTLGYKNMIENRQNSSTILSSTENNNDGFQLGNYEYIRKVEKEISRICDEFCSILDEHVIPASNSAEDQAYYYKMIGDTYAYHAGVSRFLAANKSAFVYQTAMTIAELELCASDPIRLTLALNFAVMYYNVYSEPKIAYDIAYKALEECFADETKLDHETAAKSLDIMKNLLGHLILWHLYMILTEDEANAKNDKGKAKVAGEANIAKNNNGEGNADKNNGEGNAKNDKGKANIAGYKNGKANIAGEANIAKNNNGEGNADKNNAAANIAKNANGEGNADNNNGEANIAENNNGEANAKNNNGETNAENSNGGDDAEQMSVQLVSLCD